MAVVARLSGQVCPISQGLWLSFAIFSLPFIIANGVPKKVFNTFINDDNRPKMWLKWLTGDKIEMIDFPSGFHSRAAAEFHDIVRESVGRRDDLVTSLGSGKALV